MINRAKVLVLLAAIAFGLLAAQFSHAELRLEIRQLTTGPKHHFFGYIGHVQNIPWNQSGRYLVALRTDFQDHLPRAHEAAEIVLLDTQRDHAVRVLDRTRAWNPQQGTMLYWNPDAPETQFFFNDRDPKTGKIFCVLFDISAGDGGRRVREYRFDDTPVGNSGIAQQGGWFAAINYARLARLRPVTGYPESFDWTVGESHPTNDGVFKVDTRTGGKQLLVSFKQLADAIRPLRPDVNDRALFINHTLVNRANDRIFFFARGDFDDRNHRINQGFIINADGKGLALMKQFIGGHPEWDLGHRMIGSISNRQAVKFPQKRLSVLRGLMASRQQLWLQEWLVYIWVSSGPNFWLSRFREHIPKVAEYKQRLSRLPFSKKQMLRLLHIDVARWVEFVGGRLNPQSLPTVAHQTAYLRF